MSPAEFTDRLLDADPSLLSSTHVVVFDQHATDALRSTLSARLGADLYRSFFHTLVNGDTDDAGEASSQVHVFRARHLPSYGDPAWLS